MSKLRQFLTKAKIYFLYFTSKRFRDQLKAAGRNGYEAGRKLQELMMNSSKSKVVKIEDIKRLKDGD